MDSVTQKKNSLNRRQFVKAGAQSALAATLWRNVLGAAPVAMGGTDALGSLLPTRPLGATGESLTLLGTGGAHVSRMNDSFAHRFIEKCLEEGIRFFDTAHGYGRGKSEEHLGAYLTPKYREHVFIMTKSTSRTAEAFERQFYLSLKRMRTDYVDLMFLHGLKSVEDVDERQREGVFDKIREIQAKGHARFLGFSSHTHTSAALHFLEKTDSDPFIACGMTPVNPVDAAHPDNSFTRDVLPQMTHRGYGHLAMKTLAGGALAGGKMANKESGPEHFPIPARLSFEETFFFVLSQPVASWVSGMDTLEQLKFNAEIARKFTHLTESDKARIVASATGYQHDPRMEAYKVSRG